MLLSTNWRTLRWVVLGLAAIVALLVWASASAQPETPYQVYGYNEPGDEIAIYDADGNEKGTATADSEGAWFTQIECSEDTVHLLSFTVNGVAATAEVKRINSTLAEVTLTAAADEDTAMPEKGDEAQVSEDELTEEGDELTEETEELEEAGDGMAEPEDSSDDAAATDAYPDSGSGGLADEGPSTSALIGTLVVLSVLVAGAGVWGLRRRA